MSRIWDRIDYNATYCCSPFRGRTDTDACSPLLVKNHCKRCPMSEPWNLMISLCRGRLCRVYNHPARNPMVIMRSLHNGGCANTQECVTQFDLPNELSGFTQQLYGITHPGNRPSLVTLDRFAQYESTYSVGEQSELGGCCRPQTSDWTPVVFQSNTLSTSSNRSECQSTCKHSSNKI